MRKDGNSQKVVDLRILLEFVRMRAGGGGRVGEKDLFVYLISVPRVEPGGSSARDTGIQDARCAWKLGKFGNAEAEGSARGEERTGRAQGRRQGGTRGEAAEEEYKKPGPARAPATPSPLEKAGVRAGCAAPLR